MNRQSRTHFTKCATILRKKHKRPAAHIFTEEDEKKVRYVSDAYEIAIQFAAKLIENDHVKRNIAIFGRMTFVSEIAFFANVMVGNTALCLDIEEKSNFYHVTTIEADTVMVDMDRLSSHLDLTRYDCIKYVYTIGTTANYKLKINNSCKMYNVYLAEDTTGSPNGYVLQTKATDLERRTVLDFEPEANKSQWLTYNFSSGSTGPAKLQIFKNQSFLVQPIPGLTGITEQLGYLGAAKFIAKLILNPNWCAQNNFNGFMAQFCFLTILCLPGRSRTMAILDQRNPESWARVIEHLKAVQLIFYAPQLHILLRTDSFRKRNLSSVQNMIVGGSPFLTVDHRKLLDGFQEFHGTKPVIKNQYSATEIGLAPFTSSWTSDENIQAESVGKPVILPDYKYRVRHLTANRFCTTHEEGEIEIFSPARMFNYWKDKDQPQVEWIQMGDSGYLDEHRNLYLTGRLKEIIILKNAKKINSTDVERIFTPCSLVIEVCAKAKPNENSYDDIHVFVYSSSSAELIMEFMMANVPDVYEVKLHVQNTPLPKLSNGKINGRQLIENV